MIAFAMIRQSILRPVLTLCCALLVAGPAVSQNPDSSKQGDVPPPNDRLQETLFDEVRVTTAVPSGTETRQIFGANLYRRNIQPVWVQIENRSDKTLWFLPLGLDKQYFTPIETIYRRAKRNAALDFASVRDIYDSSMRLRLEPGAVRSGYVFSRVDEGTKSFNVDVVGDGGVHFLMTFFVQVPGLRIDHYKVDWKTLYSKEQVKEVDRAGLIAGLEALPCCATDDSGKENADPLNIALVGHPRQLYYALIRAGWDETETVYRASVLKTIASSLMGKEYRYSPISSLYVFGRRQDAAFQKARANVDQRNHLRIWMTPMRYEGKPVWIGQISRDIGVRLTWKTITTHKIDPDVDETREYLLEDFAYAQSLEKLGYVKGVGAAPYDEPRGNLTGDPYFTDGLRVVLFVAPEPTNISEIEVLDLGSAP
ncbi:MAG: LssY C-terminal domain-containing protein [Betaproteobacteria bacterium]|nr:MAG: LssY C-terminal domain-containing protein [Betaproteobacteria bacterium]